MPPYRVVTTYFHAAPKSPLAEPTLLTDTRLRFLNSCVPSEVAPGYAPAGSSLVATSVLGEDTESRESALRDALSEAYGTDTAGWGLLTVRTVHEALPAMPPPQPLTRTSRAGAAAMCAGTTGRPARSRARWPPGPGRPARSCATWAGRHLSAVAEEAGRRGGRPLTDRFRSGARDRVLRPCVRARPPPWSPFRSGERVTV